MAELKAPRRAGEVYIQHPTWFPSLDVIDRWLEKRNKRTPVQVLDYAWIRLGSSGAECWNVLWKTFKPDPMFHPFPVNPVIVKLNNIYKSWLLRKKTQRVNVGRSQDELYPIIVDWDLLRLKAPAASVNRRPVKDDYVHRYPVFEPLTRVQLQHNRDAEAEAVRHRNLLWAAEQQQLADRNRRREQQLRLDEADAFLRAHRRDYPVAVPVVTAPKVYDDERRRYNPINYMYVGQNHEDDEYAGVDPALLGEEHPIFEEEGKSGWSQDTIPDVVRSVSVAQLKRGREDDDYADQLGVQYSRYNPEQDPDY